MIVLGKVHRFSDNIDTDIIIPARYLNVSSKEELAQYCMRDLDENFAKNVSQGDIIVAGNNFGCGSSREHAPIAIKECGISCVIAKSFARIFYRNAINIGLPIFECVEADKIKPNEMISVDFSNGIIKTSEYELKTQPFPEFIQKIISCGGLLNKIKSEINGE